MPGQPQLELPVPPTMVLNIDMTDLEVIDPSNNPSNFIIDAGAQFKVSAKFLIGGSSAAWFAGTATKFTVEYYYEGFGNAPEGTLGTVPGNDSSMGVASTTWANVFEYSGSVTEWTVPINTLTPGLYKLSAMVTFQRPPPDPPGPPMFAYIDGPMIQQV